MAAQPGAEEGKSQHTFTQTQSEVGLALVVYSEAASSNSTPSFHDESVVAGYVELSFRKKRKMEAVLVKLQGYQKLDMVQWLDQEEKDHDRIFLQMDAQLWPPEGSADKSMEPGTYCFPFSFKLPRKTVNLGRSGSLYALPPSFTTEYFPDHLVYEVVARTKRGGFFREDETLIAPIRYIPRPVAATPSPSRCFAYSSGQPLQSPEADAGGWKLENLSMTGNLFGKPVSVSCEFALAAPLDYPRGFHIPYILKIESDSEEALAAFSSKSAMSVALHRVVARFKRARAADISKSKVVSRGVCWMNQGDKPGVNSVRLQGELMVPLSVGPGFSFKHLSLLYHITLSPAVAGFDCKDAPSISIPVKVAYFPPEGVKPRSYAPAAPHSAQTAEPSTVARAANLVVVS